MDVGLLLGFLCVSLCGLGSLFSILALALNSWQTAGNTSVGLWKVCTAVQCFSFSQVSSELAATRAMMVLGMLMMIAATILACLYILVMKENNSVMNGGGTSAFISGFFIMIAFGIYANKLKVPGSEYGGAFALAILSWLIAWTVCGLLVAVRRLRVVS